MRVRIEDRDRMIIIAETDFEEEYLSRYSSSKCWLKRGLTLQDVVGLVIESVPSAQGE